MDSYGITKAKECCVCFKIISRKAGFHTYFWLSRPKLIIGLCTTLCTQDQLNVLDTAQAILAIFRITCLG